jgi:two-component sensor histidine kinase
MRDRPDPADFQDVFSARLSALARGHSLLTKALWQGTALEEIVEATLTPFRTERGDEAIHVDGPALRVKPSVAVTLCLMLHELATNAAKHGALGTPGGRVELRWRRYEASDETAHVELLWREEDGPAVTPPGRKGFGSRLIAASAQQLGGTAALEFAESGVRCRLDFPLQDAIAA